MEAIVKITDRDGQKVVSARELYLALGYDISQWPRWYKKNIADNPFAIKNQDWTKLNTNDSAVYDIKSHRPFGGRTPQDFAISLDFAKRLSMMARTDAGERCRRYFIEMEELAKQPKPVSATHQLLHQALILYETEKRVTNLEHRVDELEAKAVTAPLDYFAIVGYATLCKIPVDVRMAATIGKKAKAMCMTYGYTIGRVPDPRFGAVNTYPREILYIIFKELFPDRQIAAIL